jgi:hypothetical protein
MDECRLTLPAPAPPFTTTIHRGQAEALVQPLRAEGLEASAFGVNGQRPDELRRMAGEVVQRYGGVDTMISANERSRPAQSDDLLSKLQTLKPPATVRSEMKPNET